MSHQVKIVDPEDILTKEEREGHWDFVGNTPALPPLTAESVTTVVYLEDETEK